MKANTTGGRIENLIGEIEQADIVHFICHTEHANTVIQLNGDKEFCLTPSKLSKLKTAPRLVWINACSASGAGLGEFASALTAAGCPHILGSLAPVQDHRAESYSAYFYRRILGGETFADSVWQLRKHLSRVGDPAWASIVAYGPSSRIF